MNHSKKPVKDINDLIGEKKFIFPDELSNDRIQDTLERCILLRVNGQNHRILTGKIVTITSQEFAILKDAGIVSGDYNYAQERDYDPVRSYIL